MLKYIAQRLLWSILVILCVALLTFTLIHQMPGSPWTSRPGQVLLQNVAVDESVFARLNEQYGLNKPLLQQFAIYLIGQRTPEGDFSCGFICGNLGPSLRQRGRIVSEILFDPPENGTRWQSRAGYTLRLVFLGMFFTILLGLPFGILSAIYQGRLADRTISVLSAITISVPNFVLGLLMIVVFAGTLQLIKVRPDWTQWQAWIVPAFILALAPAGMLARITRTVTLDAIHGDYVRTARAKGLSESQIIIHHVLKNASLPIITYLVPLLMEFVAFSFIIEAMFSFPGFGREYYEAILHYDYFMIMAITLFYGIFLVFANLVVDLLYGVLDPRVSLVDK